jgi:membrane protease YdiL (CAAX protease family)
LRKIGIECIVLYVWVFLIVWVNVQNTITGSFIIGTILPMLLYIHYVDRKRISDYLRLRVDRWLCGISWGLGLGLVFISISLTKAVLMGQGKLWFAWPAGYWLNPVITASTVEELFFRGFLLNKFAEKTSFFRANFLVSLMFIALHIPVWSTSGIVGWNILGNATYVGILSGLFGYLYYRTQSLWTPIILHAANNYLTLITVGMVYQ